jgi:hypothetical protein
LARLEREEIRQWIEMPSDEEPKLQTFCTRTAISAMEKEWPQLEWSTIGQVYPTKARLYKPSRDTLTQRAIGARKGLRSA